MTSVALVSFLKATLLLGSALTVLKLYRTGLYRRYPVFFNYFIFLVVASIWPLILDISSPLYQKIWMISSPITLAFYILMVVELYRLVLENYKGLYSLGRWALYIGVVVSVTVSALSLIPKIKPSMPQRSKLMFFVLATERGVDTALAILILLILCFLTYFPVKLSRNVRVHATVYSVFFLSNTFILLMRSLFGLRLADEFNTALLGVMVASVFAWLTLLSPAGEVAQPALPDLGTEHEHRLLHQLDALNAVLLKTPRRRSI
jgi:hypothetical protein